MVTVQAVCEAGHGRLADLLAEHCTVGSRSGPASACTDMADRWSRSGAGTRIATRTAVNRDGAGGTDRLTVGLRTVTLERLWLRSDNGSRPCLDGFAAAEVHRGERSFAKRAQPEQLRDLSAEPRCGGDVSGW